MNTAHAQRVLKNASAMAEAVDALEADLEDWVKALSVMPLDPEQARLLQRSMMLLTRTCAQLTCSLNASARG